MNEQKVLWEIAEKYCEELAPDLNGEPRGQVKVKSLIIKGQINRARYYLFGYLEGLEAAKIRVDYRDKDFVNINNKKTVTA